MARAFADHQVDPLKYPSLFHELLNGGYSEPEAAAVHCARMTEMHQLKPSQNFMICDAGGGTVVGVQIQFHSS